MSIHRQAIHSVAANMAVAAALVAGGHIGLGFVPHHLYHFECFDADGNLKWEEIVPNIVVNTGLNDILTNYWKGVAYTAAHYVGLKAGATDAVAGDTMASHAGWTEDTTYSNANRPTLTLGSVASQSVDNSASKAAFTINGTATIDGAFVTTNNTKGGTSGTLIGAADFAAARAVINGDTLNVTVTLTAASG